MELSPLPLPLPPPFPSVCLSFPFALYGCRLLFPYSPSAPFYLSLLPPFRSPSPPFRAFWLYRFFRATLRRQHPSRIPKEKESWVPGMENLNTYDPEGRFYAKCALSNDEKTRFLPSRERGPVTKNYFPEFPTSRNTCEINLSRREIINNKDRSYEFCFLVSLPSCLLDASSLLSCNIESTSSDRISLIASLARKLID